MPDFRMTLCLDFDGVIHSYEKGWQEGVIYGKITSGFLAWAVEASKAFDLVIYSSRSKDPDGIDAMKEWFKRQLAERLIPNEVNKFLALFTFSHEKPTAWLTIDDRVVRFDGRWDVEELKPENLARFRPWNARQ